MTQSIGTWPHDEKKASLFYRAGLMKIYDLQYFQKANLFKKSEMAESCLIPSGKCPESLKKFHRCNFLI